MCSSPLPLVDPNLVARKMSLRLPGLAANHLPMTNSLSPYMLAMLTLQLVKHRHRA